MTCITTSNIHPQATLDKNMENNPFLKNFKGSFNNMLRWPQLDSLWATLRLQENARWYVYAIGETPPDNPMTAEELDSFINEINTLLRKEHKEDYCGIVYADNPASPRMIKIYDPDNLGVVCGFSEAPPLPGWVLSLEPPCDLPAAIPPPANRRRWWQRLCKK
ncbi:MAG: hypothetical protein QNK31_06295 [Porticoccus sp.]|nr:hypothetical protein [Porticoccus sp.]